MGENKQPDFFSEFCLEYVAHMAHITGVQRVALTDFQGLQGQSYNSSLAPHSFIEKKALPIPA
jgi:hypothetical protein